MIDFIALLLLICSTKTKNNRMKNEIQEYIFDYTFGRNSGLHTKAREYRSRFYDRGL